MKKTYNKTKWIDGKTPIDANKLNKLEDAIKDIYDNAIESGMLTEGDGITITSDGMNLKISTGKEVMKSNSVTGIETVIEVPETYERNKLYFVLDPDTKDLKDIVLNGITIFTV